LSGNLTDDPKVRYTDGGIAGHVPGGRVGAAGAGAVVSTLMVWRDQAEHAAESLAKGSRVMVVGPAPAAEPDRRGWQRPILRRGAGRGARTEPAVGGGDDHGNAQLRAVAQLDRCDEWDANRAGVPLRRVRAGEV
jgi:hypothetical protein